jgi:uncharacterized protein YgiM (DUF1202 family)
MNQNALKLLRGVVGTIVLLALLLVIRGWWSEYQATPTARSVSTETSATASSDETKTPAEEKNDKPMKLTVLIDGLNLREKPAIDAKVVRGLKKKETLEVLELKGDWYQVKTPKDEEGWISANSSYTQIKKK